MQSRLPRILPVAPLAVWCVFLTLGCSAPGSDSAALSGSLSLGLTLADVVEIGEVQWVITGGDMEPMSGTISTSAPGSTASVEVFGIPPDEDYLIAMEAVATDSETTCKGSATFDIEAGDVTEVHVMLNCKQPVRFGGVRVNGWFNHCAELVKVVVSPLQTSVGHTIDLFSDAVDHEGDTITTMWTGSGGTITNPKAPSTTYTCIEAGQQQVRVVVSDDDFTQCMSDWTVAVTCVADDTGCLTDADCNDGNECTADICQPDGSCSSLETPNTGSPCASGEGTCDATGVCQPNNICLVDGDCPNTPPAPADPSCTAAICDRSGFASVCNIDFTAAMDATCDFSAPASADGMCTTTGECVEAASLCAGAPDGTDCSVENPPLAECLGGVCRAFGCSSDLDCDDGSVCTTSTCDVIAGSCNSSAANEGGDCSAENPPVAVCGSGVCNSQSCATGSPALDNAACDSDGNDCTFAPPGTCDQGTGICGPLNLLQEGAQCSLPDIPFAACIDNKCTESVCTSDEQCDPLTQCDERGVCDLETGACGPPMPVENGDPCEHFRGVTGQCVSGICGCADDSACSPGGECRGPSVCHTGSGSCNIGDAINGGDPCNSLGRGPESGRCGGVLCRPVCSVAPCADNGIECVRDLCDPTDGSCNPVNVPLGVSCDFDGQQTGKCDGAGTCLLCGVDADCNDDNPCTADTCNADSGGCTYDATGKDGAGCLLEDCPPSRSAGTCGSGACLPNSECEADSECPNAPSSPADPECTVAVCNTLEGCSNFCEIDLGANLGGACDVAIPGAGNGTCGPTGDCVLTGVGCAISGSPLGIACSNSVTAAQSPFPNSLSILVTESIVAGMPFTVNASGVGAFPEFFLTAAQSIVPGGVRSAIIEGFNATVEAASGGTGSILLQADASGIAPGLTRLCTYPSTTVCTEDSDCVVAPCKLPVLIVGVPRSEDCGPGGVCERMFQGFASGPASQCNITDPPSFCITGDLPVPLVGAPSSFTPDVDATEIAFNWVVDPATVKCPDPDPRCASSGGTLPDGTLALPPSVYGDPINDPASIGPNGIRLNVGGALFVALQCTPARFGRICGGGANGGLACDSHADCPASNCTFATDIVVDSDPATFPSCPVGPAP